jgi:hypothetical protein
MNGKMMLRLVLITAKACFVSSALTTSTAQEGHGFEQVSDIGHWLETRKTGVEKSFLRGSNHTGLETGPGLLEALDLVFGNDFGRAWAPNHTTSTDEEELYGDLADEGDGRLLAQMSTRDRQWLNSHNKRRQKYHSKYNKKYVPLKWSPKLKRSSKRWAIHLANLCGRQGIYHDPNNRYGENLASNWGTGSWASQPSTDSVLTRLVENEEKLGYPQNGHFTQVLWKGTKFVGCAEHTKILGSGKKCHVQVCRYAK